MTVLSSDSVYTARIRTWNTGKTALMAMLCLLFGSLIIIAGLYHYKLFHTVIELFGVITAVSITLILINTHYITRNEKFTFFGVGYGFISFYSLLHILSVDGLDILDFGNRKVAIQLSFASHLIEVFILLSAPLVFSILARTAIRPFALIGIFAVGIVALTACIVLAPGVPVIRSTIAALKALQIDLGNLVVTLLLVVVLILILTNRKMSKSIVYVPVILFICTKIIAEFFLVVDDSSTGIFMVLAHVFRLISFVFLYRSMLELNLRNPVKTLFFQLSTANAELKEKNEELSAANELLRKEIAQRNFVEEELGRSEEQYRILKESAQLEKQRSEFIANISHELRTPLNVVLGTLQLLDLYMKNHTDPCSFPDSMAKHTANMKQNCRRLLRLVNNLIDVTKIDAGYVELHLQQVDIVILVEEITLSVESYTSSKGIQLLFDTDIEEKQLACDPDKMERILLNLLSNAIKFTDAGGSIMVTLRSMQGGVAISVKDTGIGIPEDKQQLVFERFRQVNETLTRSHEGSGIGLDLVKSFVEMHFGRVVVHSQPGKGSEFVVYLPDCLDYEGESIDNRGYQGKVYSHSDFLERINIELADIY